MQKCQYRDGNNFTQKDLHRQMRWQNRAENDLTTIITAQTVQTHLNSYCRGAVREKQWTQAGYGCRFQAYN